MPSHVLSRVVAFAAVCLCAAFHPTLALPYSPTAHGILINFSNKAIVELAVQGMWTFRVSVLMNTSLPYNGAIPTAFVDNTTAFAPFTIISAGSEVGIKTVYGQQSIDPTTAHYTLLDAAGNPVTSSVLFPLSTADAAAAAAEREALRMKEAQQVSSSSTSNSTAFVHPHQFVYSPPTTAPNKDTCSAPRVGMDVTGGTRIPAYPDGVSNQSQNQCCSLCNSQQDCTTWVWADPQHPDPSGKNCWLLMNVPSFVSRVGRVSGGSSLPPPATVTLSLGIKNTQTTQFFGAGGGYGTVTNLASTSSYPHVSNTEFFVPHYWCNDGYAALGVTTVPYDTHSVNAYDASWAVTGNTVTWQISGAQGDLYLMPSATMGFGLAAYWNLTGRPPLLPRYAYGFMASRWGWTNRAYIDQTLQQFRNGSFPIDAWISDFEWYTPQPDYSLPDSGSPTFVDFGYNNITFPQPIDQLKYYHDVLHFRFGGIRKPRLGNTDTLNMARSKGWLLTTSAGGSGGARNINYTIPEVRDWYAEQLAHFLPDGVDFWWNDEGETIYPTFYYWNAAQLQALRTYDAKKRFFTINRSFMPGMQALGVVVWTGDITVSWDSMQHQPAYATSWTLAGTPYITCDIGGFNGPDDAPDLLVRWYQSGLFLPIYRVHSTLQDLPHFPFLYGDFPARCMRNALNLRYQLLPYIYSAASGTFAFGSPITGPLALFYPFDQSVYSITSQWMFGPSIMATPILTSSDGTTSDTSRQVYLPSGTWYALRYGADSLVAGTFSGPTTITISNVLLNEIPFFVPAGAVIPMAPASIQYTDALPGGPLSVAVFPGKDGSFVVYEDDGETLAYTTGAFRTISLDWNDAQHRLTWAVNGSFTDPHVFTSLSATVYFATGAKTSPTADVGMGGTFQF